MKEDIYKIRTLFDVFVRIDCILGEEMSHTWVQRYNSINNDKLLIIQKCTLLNDQFSLNNNLSQLIYENQRIIIACIQQGGTETIHSNPSPLITTATINQNQIYPHYISELVHLYLAKNRFRHIIILQGMWL